MVVILSPSFSGGRIPVFPSTGLTNFWEKFCRTPSQWQNTEILHAQERGVQDDEAAVRMDVLRRGLKDQPPIASDAVRPQDGGT
jgi:hypothetical protein